MYEQEGKVYKSNVKIYLMNIKHFNPNSLRFFLFSARYWTNKLRIKDATVYKVSGVAVKKYDIHNDFDDEDLGGESKGTSNGENVETS